MARCGRSCRGAAGGARGEAEGGGGGGRGGGEGGGGGAEGEGEGIHHFCRARAFTQTTSRQTHEESLDSRHGYHGYSCNSCRLRLQTTGDDQPHYLTGVRLVEL